MKVALWSNSTVDCDNATGYVNLMSSVFDTGESVNAVDKDVGIDFVNHQETSIIQHH